MVLFSECLHKSEACGINTLCARLCWDDMGHDVDAIPFLFSVSELLGDDV